MDRKVVDVQPVDEGVAVSLDRLAVREAGDILPAYRGTPVGDLLAYHNLDAPHRRHVTPELLIGTCMDHRVHLRIPSDFAFVLRCAGANLEMLGFDISFAVGVAGIQTLCVIGHDECRMIDVASQRKIFVAGLVDNAGWSRREAEAHFDEHHPCYGFVDVAGFVWQEARRLENAYAGTRVAPLIYALDDRRLYQLVDANETA